MPESAPHYLLITVGSTGDIHPFMRIAGALQAMGRKVTLITHSYYRNVVQSAGIPFVGIGTDEEFLSILRNPDIWDPKKGFSALLANYSEGLKQVLEAIRSVSAQAPQVVIAHPFAAPGAVIARECGLVKSVVGRIPCTVESANLPRPSVHRPHVSAALGTDELATCALALCRKRLD